MTMISFFSQMGKTSTNTVDSASATSKSTGNEAVSFLTALQGTLQTDGESQTSASTSGTPIVFNFMNTDQEANVSPGGNLIADEEAALSLEAVIEDLISTLEQDEDHKSGEDAELIAELSDWLQQALSYLYPVSDENTGEQNESSQAITTLSENPETVKYALQEVLFQLVEVSKTNPNAAALTEESIHTQQQLIASLKEIFQKSDMNTESVAKLSSLVSELSRIAVSTPSTEATEFSMQPFLKTVDEGDELQSKATKEMVQSAANEPGDPSEDTVVTQAVNSDEGIESQATNLTTAGQLAIKNGTAPLTKLEHVMPVQQFAKDMSEFVVSKFEFVKQHGMSEAVISLRPQHLGQLDVQLTMQNGHLVARFMTEHAGAKELLEQQMTQLRAVLTAQGIQVEKLEVTQNTSLSSHMYQDGGSSNGQSGNQHRSKEREQKNEDALRTAEIQDELRTWMQEQQDLELYTGTDQTNGFTAKV
ncbi:flagellar hook-length control protein FliK [Paenibacillus sp. Marseille-Q4541]|uniref:flagellar hook-length control protein FliK n=1 Tax=Paenibacillus sp. Marseille-Q4541 TaxID=2831522 RepID=UPI001BAB68F6|nr:flagellar hook-length control protein FliK [Paenibacillus sp. Marseille-Q4541]